MNCMLYWLVLCCYCVQVQVYNYLFHHKSFPNPISSILEFINIIIKLINVRRLQDSWPKFYWREKLLRIQKFLDAMTLMVSSLCHTSLKRICIWSVQISISSYLNMNQILCYQLTWAFNMDVGIKLKVKGKSIHFFEVQVSKGRKQQRFFDEVH